ncbi:MAG: M56 family metallopeptidase [Thermoguttaceae bacterium]
MLNALLWNLLLTAGLAIVLAVLSRLTSLRKRPALRHWLWLLLLVKLVTPPLIAVPLLPAAVVDGDDTAAIVAQPAKPMEPRASTRDQQRAGVNSAADAMAFAGIGCGAGEITAAEPQSHTHALFLGGLLAVSLIGTCVLLTVQGVHGANVYRWLRRAGRENSLLAESCDAIASSLGIHAVVRSCVVDARTTPLLWGWRRPLVVVPRRLIEDLSPQQLRSIVAHELAHFLRRDHWVNVFVLIVKGLLWWNPVVWWADRELRAAQELCCDAIAIDRCDANRRSYAVTLLKALDFVQTEPLAPRALAAGMGSRRSILRRFEMIGETQLSYRLSRWTSLILLALAIPLVCIPVRGQDKAPATPAASDAGDAKVSANAEGKKEGTAQPEPAKTGNAADGQPIDPKIRSLGEATLKVPSETVVGQRPRGNCSISGSVVSAAADKPVGHARLYLHYNITHGSIFINTADDGTFTFQDIPEGPFSLQVSHSPGYQDVSYNPEGKPGPFPPFSLKDSEHRSGIVLKAKQSCRVSGKILGENGKLPENIDTLTVLAWSKEDDGKKYRSEQAHVNRAGGSYSIDGLDGKPVYVMAINWQAAQEGDACPPIYYPGTFSRKDAKLIIFDKEKSVDNVNITLQKAGGLTLEGTVRDEAGNPVPEAFVVADRRDMLFDFVTAYTDEQGRYQIEGLGEGEFTVHVDAVHRGFVRMRTPLDLDKDSKKTRRDFTLARGVAISGKLVDEKGKDWQIGSSYGYANVIKDKADKSDFSNFSLTHFWNKYRPENVAMHIGGSFALGEGGYCSGDMHFPTKSTFMIQGMMPGNTTIGFLPNQERQKVVKILYDGRDILKSGLETKLGQEIKDVTIVIGAE